MNGPIVVVKVGGSLLDWPELPARLQGFLENHRDDRVVLVVGGGRFADTLRDLDKTHGLGEEYSHLLALRILDVTARLLEALIPGTKATGRTSDLEPIWATRHIPILAPRRFLESDDGSTNPLPHNWSTTTDSIAARLARWLGARQLVLLKSAEIPSGLTLGQAAETGLVDPEFPTAAGEIPVVTIANLRGDGAISFTRTGHQPF